MQDNSINPGKYCAEIKTGMKPFRISRTSVVAAKNLFPVLSTFVAPIFPEPILRTSIFPKIFVTKKPNGIEPLIYENKATRIISIIN